MKALIINGISCNLKSTLIKLLENNLDKPPLIVGSPMFDTFDNADTFYGDDDIVRIEDHILYKSMQMNSALIGVRSDDIVIFEKSIFETAMFTNWELEGRLSTRYGNVSSKVILENALEWENDYFSKFDHVVRYFIETHDRDFLQEKLFSGSKSARSKAFRDVDHYLELQAEFKSTLATLDLLNPVCINLQINNKETFLKQIKENYAEVHNSLDDNER